VRSEAEGRDAWATRIDEPMPECVRGLASMVVGDSVWAVWGPLGQKFYVGEVAVSGDVALGRDGGELSGSSSRAGRRAGSSASQMGLAGTTAGPKRRQFVRMLPLGGRNEGQVKKSGNSPARAVEKH
jgi:hypothetical protein